MQYFPLETKQNGHMALGHDKEHYVGFGPVRWFFASVSTNKNIKNPNSLFFSWSNIWDWTSENICMSFFLLTLYWHSWLSWFLLPGLCTSSKTNVKLYFPHLTQWKCDVYMYRFLQISLFGFFVVFFFFWFACPFSSPSLPPSIHLSILDTEGGGGVRSAALSIFTVKMLSVQKRHPVGADVSAASRFWGGPEFKCVLVCLWVLGGPRNHSGATVV